MVAKKLVAVTAFVVEHDGQTIVVHDGDVFASTHPIVKEHAELFAAPESEVPMSPSGAKRQR